MTSSATAAALPGGNTVLVEIIDRVAWVTMNRPLYVTEFQFRYNNRFNPDMFGTAISGC
jgi:hypothetical protein